MPQRICSESLVKHPSAASQKSVDGSADPAQGIHQRFACADGTEIFNVRAHTAVGVIGSSEDMVEIDFGNGKFSQVGDQYGIGRR